MSLNKLFDDIFSEKAEQLGGSALMSEVREAALAEFVRRVSIENSKVAEKPKHWKQDTPPEQAVAIISAIEGWLGNLGEGISRPEVVAKSLELRLQDLKILYQGWLKKVW